MRIDGTHPFVKRRTLCLVLLIILAFDFKYQMGAVSKADYEVGDVLLD
jgi:hypothetical protein